MTLHVVLFRPLAGLSQNDRSRLGVAFANAVRDIPSIRRVEVGTRVTHGRGYEALMRSNLSHIAILEFDDTAGLRAYLEHPAHEALGGLFFEAFEEALIYDFDVKSGAAGIADLLES
jgi:hypothetical protein